MTSVDGSDPFDFSPSKTGIGSGAMGDIDFALGNSESADHGNGEP